MSKIVNIIGEAYFEIVRSRIAAILIDELTAQKALNEAALLIEEAKEAPDDAVIAALELNISAIPSKVWEERFKRPCQDEIINEPLINVVFTNAPLNDNVTACTQIGDDTFMIEVYVGNTEPDSELPEKEGDSLAAIKLQRCLAICRAILMNPNYQTLGFEGEPYFIGKSIANSLQIAQPDDGADNSNNAIRGKFDLTVKISETVEQVTGVVLALNDTTLKFYDTDLGYYWTHESN